MTRIEIYRKCFAISQKFHITNNRDMKASTIIKEIAYNRDMKALR